MRTPLLALAALLGFLVLAPAPCVAQLVAEPTLPASAVLRGRIVDTSAGAVVGAHVSVSCDARRQPTSIITASQGEFEATVSPGTCVVRVHADGFIDATRQVATMAGAVTTADLTLEIAGVQESVSVGGNADYAVREVSSATRTTTPLRDVPQAVSIVSRELMADQRMSSMADVTRYMPGVGIAQGEGNRDTPVLRGNSTTADFFVDGIRDDAQYFRDVYNVDRVEALKGPNAMIFGRGGGGGVINRVTRQAQWGQQQEVSVQAGSWADKRLTADVGRGLSDTVAVRATAMYEDSDSYRNGVWLERYGINPGLAVRLGEATTLRAAYEFFEDSRVADRGVSSYQGRPVSTDPGTFFGDPAQSRSDSTVHVVSSSLEHRVNSNLTLRNRISFAAYDKFYQNVFPGAVNATGTTVAISAYNSATTRDNLFNQTDAIFVARTGSFGHTIVVGTEFGRQDTANFRNTGYFTSVGANVTSYQAPLGNPTISVPVEFRQSATDADNDGVTTVAAVFAQDQVALSRHLTAIAGVRFDSFQVGVTNNRTATALRSRDGLVSPRAGLVYKPIEPLSLYGSYSVSYLPRAGEQLSSLSLTNQALDPEEFRNYEVGTKWDLPSGLALSAALYRLDRGNVAVADPNDPTQSILVDAQRSRGLELELNGHITRAWSVAGGYAYQRGEITRSISPTASAGASLAQLPRHSVSLWNKYTFTPRLEGALGVIYRDAVFTSTDNLVVLPAWARVDAAIFYNLTRTVRLQVNVENLLDEEYFASAHNNNNITPGAPRAVRIALTTRF